MHPALRHIEIPNWSVSGPQPELPPAEQARGRKQVLAALSQACEDEGW